MKTVQASVTVSSIDRIVKPYDYVPPSITQGNSCSIPMAHGRLHGIDLEYALMAEMMGQHIMAAQVQQHPGRPIRCDLAKSVVIILVVPSGQQSKRIQKEVGKHAHGDEQFQSSPDKAIVKEGKGTGLFVGAGPLNARVKIWPWPSELLNEWCSPERRNTSKPWDALIVRGSVRFPPTNSFRVGEGHHRGSGAAFSEFLGIFKKFMKFLARFVFDLRF